MSKPERPQGFNGNYGDTDYQHASERPSSRLRPLAPDPPAQGEQAERWEVRGHPNNAWATVFVEGTVKVVASRVETALAHQIVADHHNATQTPAPQAESTLLKEAAMAIIMATGRYHHQTHGDMKWRECTYAPCEVNSRVLIALDAAQGKDTRS